MLFFNILFNNYNIKRLPIDNINSIICISIIYVNCNLYLNNFIFYHI